MGVSPFKVSSHLQLYLLIPFFPFVWQYLQQFLIICLLHIWHSCYNVIQISARIYFMRFVRCQQRTDGTHVDGLLMVSTGQVVLSIQQLYQEKISCFVEIMRQRKTQLLSCSTINLILLLLTTNFSISQFSSNSRYINEINITA